MKQLCMRAKQSLSALQPMIYRFPEAYSVYLHPLDGSVGEHCDFGESGDLLWNGLVWECKLV
jgi:hypothetical protein